MGYGSCKEMVHAQGIRVMVVAPETRIEEEAGVYAQQIESDGRPTVRFISCLNILDALPVMFPTTGDA